MKRIKYLLCLGMLLLLARTPPAHARDTFPYQGGGRTFLGEGIDRTSSGQPIVRDEEEGRKKLKEMVAALGGVDAFKQVKSTRMKMTQTLQTPNGEMNIESEVLYTVPEATGEGKPRGAFDRLHIAQTTPMGNMTIIVTPEKAVMDMQGSRQDLPAMFRDQIMDQFYRNTGYLAENADNPDLKVSFEGTETVEDTAYDKLVVTPPGHSAFTLLLDPATHLPARARYQGTGMMTGAPTSSEDVFSEYKEVSGMQTAHRIVSFQDGQPAAVSVITEVAINPDVDESLFDVN